LNIIQKITRIDRACAKCGQGCFRFLDSHMCLTNPIIDGGCENTDKDFLVGIWESQVCLGNAIIDGGCENADKYFLAGRSWESRVV